MVAMFVGTSFVCTETKSKFQYLPYHYKMAVVNGSDLHTSVSIMTSIFCGAKISLGNTATLFSVYFFYYAVYAISEVCCVLCLAYKHFSARYPFEKYLDSVFLQISLYYCILICYTQ